MADRRYYVTTAIPYVNAAPHAGHGLEAVQADALARFHRQAGDDTYFLTGSDDNSITNVRAAERESIPIADLVARNTEGFVELDRTLQVSYDQFIRTSVDPRHRLGAQKLWLAVAANGDIYKQDYEGLYCPNCELFYDKDELADGLCPEHFTPPETVRESNYFFRLSRFQDELDHLISTDTYRVIPEHRKNEVLSFIRMGLRDFSISRTQERAKNWGVPVPGDESQVMYVWFDALSNYITALGYADEEDLYRRYWVENDHRVHTIGKGIIRFHAVYWPAMLLSARLPLPHALFVHGYYTMEGKKMSKSLGNTTNPVDIAERYGSDALRYYFLGATPPTGDTDFSIDTFEARYNADLANDLGNLVNRTVSMVHRYRGGVGRAGEVTGRDDLRAMGDQVLASMEAYDFQGALAAIWNAVIASNRYIEQQAPWSLAKAEGDDPGSHEMLDAVLGNLLQTIWAVAYRLEPFLPGTAAGIRAQLGFRGPVGEPLLEAGLEVRVAEAKPLFPRLERAAV